MAIPLRLEVFETAEATEGPAFLMPEELEELRLTAFERGYDAGYDDASRQAAVEDAAAHARIAARIEALNFAYHEARAHMLTALEPLVVAICGTLLPAMARASVMPRIIEELMPLALARLERPLALHVAPGQASACRAAFEGLVLPPLTIVEDPDLDAAQAEIRAAQDTTRIDLTAAVAQIEAALATHYQPVAQEAQHG